MLKSQNCCSLNFSDWEVETQTRLNQYCARILRLLSPSPLTLLQRLPLHFLTLLEDMFAVYPNLYYEIQTAVFIAFQLNIYAPRPSWTVSFLLSSSNAINFNPKKWIYCFWGELKMKAKLATPHHWRNLNVHVISCVSSTKWFGKKTLNNSKLER